MKWFAGHLKSGLTLWDHLEFLIWIHILSARDSERNSLPVFGSIYFYVCKCSFFHVLVISISLWCPIFRTSTVKTVRKTNILFSQKISHRIIFIEIGFCQLFLINFYSTLEIPSSIESTPSFISSICLSLRIEPPYWASG